MPSRFRLNWRILIIVATLLLLSLGLLFKKSSLTQEPSSHTTPARVVKTESGRQQMLTHDSSKALAPTATLSTSIPDPLASLHPNEEAQKRIFEAGEAAIESCMQNKGFVYKRNTYTEEPANHGIEPDTEGYGLIEAMERGEIPPPPDANEELNTQLAPQARDQWQKALSGPKIPRYDPNQPITDPDIARLEMPDGGIVLWHRRSCFAEATRGLYGDDLAYRRLMLREQELRSSIVQKTLDDPQYQIGLERWQACIREKGLAYNQPSDVVRGLDRAYREGRIDKAELRKQEISTKAIDSRCNQDVGLNQLYITVQNRIEQQVRTDEAATLSALEQLYHQADQRAAKLVGRN